jgi:hypothetical protein
MRFSILVVLFASLIPLQAGKYKGLWLKVSDETAPAGSVVQIRITLTEPKPIIRTRMDLEFDEGVVGDIMSISVFSINGEASGTALRIGNVVHIEATSPTGNLGTVEELPLLALSVRLRPNAPPEASTTFRIRPESVFYEREDKIWKVEDNAPGVVKVGGNLSIDSVSPSGGYVQPGDTVRILGRGFQSASQVEIDGARVAMATVISDTEIRLNSNEPFLLDQRGIRVANPDGSETTFFTTLQSSDSSPSAYDLLAAASPLFPPFAQTSAVVTYSGAEQISGGFAGVALQNPGTDPVTVSITALAPAGNVLGAATVQLSRLARFVRNLDELMPGFQPVPGATLRLDASAPIQVLGLEGNLNTGAIQPLSPSAVQPATTASQP